ncbi:MAG: D-alanyl-D-alanine carboxypeptidase/D-alanyl-D-alanine-endopeptidase [Capsulimonadales bacterium]|nr:D-alanyl-D-alanine carboxypeptidase/D-alanyl-D-alanine-endopeptidase [Capsulimonadales bacterium]
MESLSVIIRRFSPLLLCLVLPLLPIPSSAQSPSDLPSGIDAALNVPEFKNAVVAVLVRSLDTGRTLYEKNPDVALMPASNLKLLTAATASAKLGIGFRFTTTLLRTGEITGSGELKGDLYLHGSGDPSLTSEDLTAMVRQLGSAGVRKFHGRVFVDASAFDARALGTGWEWDDESYYYCAQVAGLNCDENTVVLTAEPGKKPGDPPVVTAINGTRYLTLRNEAKTGVAGSPATVVFERARARNEVTITGSLPLDAKPVRETVTVEDPARFVGTRLWEILERSGTDTPKPEKRRVEIGIAPTNTLPVATHVSPALPKLLADFLKPSDNLYGECLLKTLGRQKSGQGTWDSGAATVRDYLGEIGVDAAGLVMADGSGLSRRNTVTARMLVDLLTAVETKLPDGARAAFVDGLPVGGQDGTLRNRFKSTAAQGVVRAKTGSLTGASSLSGYLTTVAGERLVFSILMNHYHSATGATRTRAAQDAIVLALMNVPRS